MTAWVQRLLGIRPVTQPLVMWQRTYTTAGRPRLWHAYRPDIYHPLCGSGGPHRYRTDFGADESDRRPRKDMCKLCAKRTQR